jgi:hypothetical protein
VAVNRWESRRGSFEKTSEKIYEEVIAESGGILYIPEKPSIAF